MEASLGLTHCEWAMTPPSPCIPLRLLCLHWQWGGGVLGTEAWDTATCALVDVTFVALVFFLTGAHLQSCLSRWSCSRALNSLSVDCFKFGRTFRASDTSTPGLQRRAEVEALARALREGPGVPTLPQGSIATCGQGGRRRRQRAPGPTLPSVMSTPIAREAPSLQDNSLSSSEKLIAKQTNGGALPLFVANFTEVIPQL
jgi:hypothetical protein